MSTTKQIIEAVASYRQRESVSLLNALRGRAGESISKRRIICRMILGEISKECSKQHIVRMSQYGNLRTALLKLVGATGDCKASEDADFETRALRILRGESPDKPSTEKLTKSYWTPGRNKGGLIAQYCATKEQHPDKILLFRVGDFYETFSKDAINIGAKLKLTITIRTERTDAEIDKVEMVGFPHHCLESHLQKLLAAGLKVAILEPVANDQKPAASGEGRITT